jgi:two-component system, OmpR family, sensor histidine kinase CpxA
MSLRAKVLLLAAANIGVLLAAGLVFLLTQMQANSLLLAPVRDKLVNYARLTERDLAEMRDADQDAHLRQLSKANGVRIFVAENSGRVLAGEGGAIPAEVMRRLTLGPPDRPGPPPPILPGQPSGGPRDNALFLARAAGEYWFGVRVPSRSSDRQGILRATMFFVSPSFLTNSFFINLWPLPIAASIAALVTLACWAPFVHRLTRDVAALNVATNRIAQGHYEVRTPKVRGDEIGQLSASVEALAQQLENYLAGQKRFLGDVAHELCSPLVRVQFALGILENESGPEQRKQLEQLNGEVQHISNLVNEILAFTKAGLKNKAPVMEPVAVREIAKQALHRESSPHARVDLLVPADLTAQANPDLLQRVLANLLRNAIRYAGEAGPITVDGRVEGERVVITVEDQGPGLHAGGSGLGLEIVKNCMTILNGAVAAENRKGGGLRVALSLPAR